MKKKLLSLALVLTMTAGLTACSLTDSKTATGSTDATKTEAASTDSAQATTDQKATTAEGATTIEVWSNNRHDETYMTKVVDDFNASHTDVQIKYTINSDDMASALQLAYQAGTAPDVITIAASDPISLPDYVKSGIFENLKDYIAKDSTFQQVTDAYNHKYEGLNAIGDDIYWVPTSVRSGTRIEYNKELLTNAGYDAIPSTLPELVKVAKDVTAKGNGDTYGVGFTQNAFGRWLEGIGEKSGFNHGGYDYVNGKYDFSNWKPLLESAAQFMKDGSVLPGSETQGVDNNRALFAQGSFAIWGNASQEAGVFTEQFPPKFDWGVAELPTMEGQVKGALSCLPNGGYSIISTSKHKEAAWQVVSYLSSEEVLKGYFEGGYGIPMSTYMAGKVDSTKVGRLADFALQDYEDVYPMTPAVTVEGDDYNTVFWNVVLGNVSADDAISDLNTRYNAALESGLANGSCTRLIISDFDPLHPSKGTVTYETK